MHQLQQRRRAGIGAGIFVEEGKATADDTDVDSASINEDSATVPHPLSAGSGVWASPTKAKVAALISSSLNERPGISGEEVFLGRRQSNTGSLRSSTFGGRTARVEEDSVVGAGSVITKKVTKKSLALTRSIQTEVKNYKRKIKK